jgi:hypothetical protein
MAATGWKRPFDDPILLPRGRQLVTLENAATYIQKLPKAEQQLDQWQAAVEALPGDVCPYRLHAGIEPKRRSRVQSRPERNSLGQAEIEEGSMKTVMVYVNTSKQLGDVDHLKVFASVDAAETWFEENDPEGVAFEYPVLE